MPASAPARPAPRCADHRALFLDPLLEQPPAGSAPRSERSRYARLVAAAGQVCSGCPLLADCLYAAVAEHDVAGFVAGTSAAQRSALRRRLGVTVAPEDLDGLAGVTGGHRHVDHDEIVRFRRAHPDESLDALARRLGCSLSTVKRHLRRERAGTAVRREVPVLPTPYEVLTAARELRSATTRAA